MACHGDYCLSITGITESSVTIWYHNLDAGDTTPQNFTVYASNGTTVITTGTTSTPEPGGDGSYGTATGLNPGTAYIVQLDGRSGSAEAFTTLTDDPKIATESQWRDLAAKVKAKVDSTSLATVATSGSYNDLSNKPTIPAAQVNSDWNASSGVAKILNKPTIPSIKKQTDSGTFSDVSTLYVAGDGTTSAPMALRTHGDNSNGSYAYVNINEPTSSIPSAYVGGYVWDIDEFWWRKLPEVRLALYSDISNKTTLNSKIQANVNTPIPSLNIAGNGTETYPYAPCYYEDSNSGKELWSYIRAYPIFGDITQAYVGKYGYDASESSWNGKKEARLALYSDLPTVNDSTITITNNGTTLDSFTTNASSNKTIALSSPVITMTTTDPGEGVALEANNFIAVYSV